MFLAKKLTRYLNFAKKKDSLEYILKSVAGFIFLTPILINWSYVVLVILVKGRKYEGLFFIIVAAGLKYLLIMNKIVILQR